jgi:hypothetical protein
MKKAEEYMEAISDEITKRSKAGMISPKSIRLSPQVAEVLRTNMKTAYHFDFADNSLTIETFMGMDVIEDEKAESWELPQGQLSEYGALRKEAEKGDIT